MSRYVLFDAGYSTFKQIKQGRDVVGRVTTHADGGFVGLIGADSFRASTEIDAFEGVVAKALGEPSAAVLKAKNRAVRRMAAERRNAARHVVNEMLRSNYEPFDATLKAALPLPQAFIAATKKGR